MPARKKEPRAQRAYYTLEEVRIILNLGKSKTRDLVRREGLPIVTFGRAIRVPVVEFTTWCKQRLTSSTGSNEMTNEQNK